MNLIKRDLPRMHFASFAVTCRDCRRLRLKQQRLLMKWCSK